MVDVNALFVSKHVVFVVSDSLKFGILTHFKWTVYGRSMPLKNGLVINQI